MLHVDVYIPALSKNLEFQLSEHANIQHLAAEIASVAAAKEGKRWLGDTEQLLLCSLGKRTILPQERTLQQCGIADGDRLILL